MCDYINDFLGPLVGTTTREKKRIGKSHERMVVDVSQVPSYPQMTQGCDLSTQNMLLIRKIVRFIFASAFERTTTGQNFGSYRSEISFVLFFSASHGAGGAKDVLRISS